MVFFIVFLVISESFLRIANYTAPHYVRPDLITGTRLMENAFYINKSEGSSQGYINSKGLRDYEYSYEKNEDTYRILVFGDSYIEASQVDLDSTFIKILERRLNKVPLSPNLKYEVINLGVAGYGTANAYYLYLSEGVRYDADLVILGFTHGTDLRNNSSELAKDDYTPYFYLDENGALQEDLSYRERIKPKLEGWRKEFRKLKNSIYLMSLLLEKKEILLANEKELQNEESSYRKDWNVYLKEMPMSWLNSFTLTEKIILKFKNEVEKNNSKFLLLQLTSGVQVSDKMLPVLEQALGKGNYDIANPNKILEKFANRNSVLYLDLLPTFYEKYKQTKIYYHGFANAGGEGCDCHWNEKGHKLVSDIIYEYLNSNPIFKPNLKH